MHYWVRGMCRILTRRHFYLDFLLFILCPAALAFDGGSGGCCNDGWIGNNGRGSGCCNNNGLGSPFVQPNGNISGLFPTDIFDGGFINGQNIGGFPGGLPNNRQVGGDFLESNFGPQFPQFPQNGQVGGRMPFDPTIQPPQFPISNQRDLNGNGNFPGPPPPQPQGRRDSFVGSPSPYPRQPIGPMRPQFDNRNYDNRDFDNRDFDNRNNNNNDNFGNGFIDRRGGPLLPSRPTITSTGNTNKGVTFSGPNEDPNLIDLSHPFDNHRRRRRSVMMLSRLRPNILH